MIARVNIKLSSPLQWPIRSILMNVVPNTTCSIMVYCFSVYAVAEIDYDDKNGGRCWWYVMCQWHAHFLYNKKVVDIFWRLFVRKISIISASRYKFSLSLTMQQKKSPYLHWRPAQQTKDKKCNKKNRTERNSVCPVLSSLLYYVFLEWGRQSKRVPSWELTGANRCMRATISIARPHQLPHIVLQRCNKEGYQMVIRIVCLCVA